MPPLTIGTAAARPGEITYGTIDGIALPTGGTDPFPVIIAEGKEDGPVMWITTGIHGGEHTGLMTIHQLLSQELADALRGTLIVLPALNPTGLRTKQRMPYVIQSDPNRLFPRPDQNASPSKTNSDSNAKPLSEIEEAFQRIYDLIAETQPACLFDLHNAWFGSIPFAFRDPVFFYPHGVGRTRAQAQKLQNRVGKMLDAFGFTIVNEFVADDYVSKNLHRSVSGSVLNGLDIPATTIELGSWMHIDSGVPQAAAAGLRNVMRSLDMLPGDPEPISGIPVLHPDYPVRRTIFPYAPKTGIVHHLRRPADPVQVGDPLVRMTDIYGRPILEDDGLIRSEYEGFVMAWHHGVVHYQGEPLVDLAIRDEDDLIVPYPG